MKAIRFHEFGGPEVLKYEDVPEPVPCHGEVLVRVKACALNHLDLFLRKGLPGTQLPHINGSDIAGDISEPGEPSSGFKAGQRVIVAPMVFCNHCSFCSSGWQNLCRQFSVIGRNTDGGNCEYIAVPPVNVIPIPEMNADGVKPDGVKKTLTFEEAASVPLVFLTAWHMLVGRCQIKPGEVVLILGAGSGVGSAAIQIAKLFSAQVIATAGSDAKLEKARELGADYTINHYKEKISEEVKKITARTGVDIVFEHVGKATWEESLKSLRPGGTLVTCGATSGHDVGLNINVLFGRQFSILGSYMGTMGDMHEVLKHIFGGRLKPVVDKTFPLEEARAAHERMESGKHFGKIVLTI